MDKELELIKAFSTVDGACIEHELSDDKTVDSGFTCVHSNTIILTGVTLTIEDGGEWFIISGG